MERERFERLVAEEHAGVWRVASRLLRDAHAAEDVTQALFLLVLEGKLDLREAREPGAVLRHHAALAALDALRRKRTRARHEDRGGRMETGLGTDDDTTEAERAEARERVRSELDRLEEELRVPLVLRFAEEWTFAAIARELRCSEPTAHDRVRRGLERLRTRLGPAWTAGAVAALAGEILARPVSVPPGLATSLLRLRALVPAATSGFSAALALFVLAAGAAVGAFLFASRLAPEVSVAALAPESAPGALATEREGVGGRDGDPPALPDDRRALTPLAGRTALRAANEELEERAKPDEDGALLRARLVGERGPLAGLEVQLVRLVGKGDPGPPLRFTTGSDGRLVATIDREHLVRPTSWRLVVRDGERPLFVHGPFRLHAGEERDLGLLTIDALDGGFAGRARIEVAVLDPAGMPVEGAQVELLALEQEPDDGFSAVDAGTSDGNGRVLLTSERLVPRRLHVDARHLGWRREVKDLALETGGLHLATIVLTEGLEISGRVTAVEGLTVPRVALSLRPAQQVAWTNRGVEWNDDGAFRVRGLDPGSHLLHFAGDGWSTATVTIDSGRTDIVVPLKRYDDLRDVGVHLAEVHGTFVDASGRSPVRLDSWNVRVVPVVPGPEFERDVLPALLWPTPVQVAMVFEEDDERAARRARAASGEFHLTGLEPGDYLVVVAQGEHRGWFGPFGLREGEIRRDVRIAACESFAVAGRVIDEHGRALRDAMVLVVGDSAAGATFAEAEDRALREAGDRTGRWPRGATHCGPDGTFTLTAVPQEIPWRLFALHPEREATSVRLVPGGATELELRMQRR